MYKWKLFGKSKNKEDNNYQNPSAIEYNQNTDIQNNEDNTFNQETSSQKLVEHHDALQTSNPPSKKGSSRNTVTSNNQRVWRDVPAIEENIDKLYVRPSGVPPSDLDKKVDHIIKKKEK